jgi:cytochrome c oxidase subunit 2
MDRTRRSLFRFAGGVALIGAGFAGRAIAAPRVIHVVAKRFDYAPSTIKVKRGEAVVFELESKDVPMGFNLPDFKVRTDVIPGKVARLPFTATKEGTFTFYCDIFCGSGHEDMNGTLIVTA